MKLRFSWQYLIIGIVLFLIEVIIATKLKHINFVRNILGDVIVVGLVYCFVKTFVKYDYVRLAIGVFFFACFIEFLQYLKFVDVFNIQNKIARTVIGTTFSWHDILAYFIGTILVIIIEKFIRKMTIK